MATHSLSIGHEVMRVETEARSPGKPSDAKKTVVHDIVVQTRRNGGRIVHEPLGCYKGTIPHQDLERFANEQKISMAGLGIAAGHERVVHDVESQETFEPKGSHNFSVVQVGNEKRFHVYTPLSESEKERLRKLLNP